MEKTIYQKAIESMDKSEIGNHESDLYLKCTPVSEKLVSEYDFRSNVKRFRSAIDGLTWFDIPFGFDPFWK